MERISVFVSWAEQNTHHTGHENAQVCILQTREYLYMKTAISGDAFDIIWAHI